MSVLSVFVLYFSWSIVYFAWSIDQRVSVNEIFSVERMDLSWSCHLMCDCHDGSVCSPIVLPLTKSQFWHNCCRNSSQLPYSTSLFAYCSGNPQRRPPSPQAVHPTASDNENYSFEDAQLGRRPSKTHKTAPEDKESDSETESCLPDSLFNRQKKQRGVGSRRCRLFVCIA